MPDDASFAELMARVRAGDRDASYEVFNRFVQRLIGLARGRLDGVIRRKVDPEDVAQSVLKSFFSRHANGQFDLQGWDGLWALLAQITVRKCGRWNTYYRARRRKADRETHPQSSPSGSGEPWEALGGEPTPLEVASLIEMVQHLLAGLNESEREILTMRLQDYTVAEISSTLGRTEYMVNQVLKRVRKQLQQLQDRDAMES